jgi:hypothetical protein
MEDRVGGKERRANGKEEGNACIMVPAIYILPFENYSQFSIGCNNRKAISTAGRA